MAHNINEGRIFYVKADGVPWHGIGTALDKPATATEAITAAKLNYEIGTRPILTSDKVTIKDRVATVREDTKVPLGIVSPMYRIIQNVDAFSFFDNVVGSGQAVYHTAGALGNGERIWILAKLPNDLVLKGNDVVEKYLLLINSHDGKTCLRMYFTPVRVVCQNTLNQSMLTASSGISIRHAGDIKGQIYEAQRVLGIATITYAEYEKTIRLLADRPVTEKELNSYYNWVLFGTETVNKEKTSKILLNRLDYLKSGFERAPGNDIKGIRGTLWAAYNSVTYYTDHQMTAKDASSRLKNVWFGAGAKLKERAFERATQLVTAK